MTSTTNPIFIVGPTAAGKTAVALALARALGHTEIVSADSMQVYRGMDIGTAKPTAEERAAVPHHLIDVCEPGDHFDVRQYLDLAENQIRQLQQRGQRVLVVGGTGLYLRALRQGLFSGPGRDPLIRARLEMLSAPTLFAELARVDPATAATIDRHNPRRLVRALEVFHATGQPISQLQRETTTQGRLPAAPGFVLARERDDLTARIEARIDAQMAAGWLAEVRALLARPRPPLATAMQAAGYRELAAHLRGELTLAEAVALVKTKTRQLAKRQLTWFRKEPELTWFTIERDEPPSRTASRIMQQLPREQQVNA